MRLVSITVDVIARTGRGARTALAGGPRFYSATPHLSSSSSSSLSSSLFQSSPGFPALRGNGKRLGAAREPRTQSQSSEQDQLFPGVARDRSPSLNARMRPFLVALPNKLSLRVTTARTSFLFFCDCRRRRRVCDCSFHRLF